jgi:hypothetical protein
VPPDSDPQALNDLILFLDGQPVMSAALAKARSAAFMRETSLKMQGSGGSFGEATGILPHLNRPDAKQYLRSIDNNLVEQVKITRTCAEAWFAHGEHPPPGYAWRITVILRKNNDLENERRFLSAYCRHFYNTLGTRDARIAERAVKIGACPP